MYKRLGRARSRLRELPFESDDLSTDQLTSRLPAVQSVLYLLFTEGYLSSHAEAAIRRELCDEAKRLTLVLAEHSVGGTPETFALLALMHLHAARITARQDGSGGLLLLGRALHAPHAEPCGCGGRVARTRGGARDRRGARATIVARGIVHVEGRAGRSPPTMRE